MIVELWKRVPLVVEVDLETGEIVKAIIVDESEPDYEWEQEMSACRRVTGDGPADYEWVDPTDDEYAAAVAIADNAENEWPAWQFGP